MDVVLPYRIKNEQKFFDCAFKMGFDEMSVHKFLYMFHQSDVDTFPSMGDDRINVLIYGWVLCEEYRQSLPEDEWELPEEIDVMIKILVPWSLDIWFSREWDRCKLMLRHGLIHCLNRARGMLMRSPDMMQLNWEFLLLYNQTPWQVPYLKSLTVTKEKTLDTGGLTIETEELPATDEDLKYIKLEQFPLIVLRMVKLFDQGSIDMVKTLCMRVLSAWNKVYHKELETAGSRLPYVPPEDKRCLLLICHIYLMAVYEADDVKGYVIDNMINNIRFYYQCFQTNNSSYAMDNLSYTPARFIALTAIHLRLQKRELFDFYIWNCAESSPVNLYGVISQAYKSYLLGNLLMELNNMSEENFAANAALYKRLMNSYVNEREKSEIFMLGEIQKHEAQRYAHNMQHLVKMTDFKSKICKGNRMGNIGNYENADDVAANKIDKKINKIEHPDEEQGGGGGDDGEEDEIIVKETENELSVDPIFQNIPNNEEILYFVYDVILKKTYRGWQFAKIVLLFKIINHELNMLETWRYHPGLTTNFMLNLESKLSQHYIDLAKIFKDYPFMEQEFWLTAFYLNPTHQCYEAVKRLGIRFNRKKNEEPNKWSSCTENVEAKYGLLSSTIDVKEIVVLTNADDQNSDYIPLTEALHSLHLPDSVIKDILTVIFLPRNRSFSWAVEWNDLRRRCKILMTNASEKRRFVELTMAEANDRLKFLNIDYEKYKNRPQLDYGSIEQGYENVTGDVDGPSDDSEEEEDDFEDDEDVYESQKTRSRGRKKQEEVDVNEDDNSQDDDPYLVGRRRTRARTAAAMASLLSSSEITTRRKRRLLEEEMRENEEKLTDQEEKSNDSKSTEAVVAPTGLDDTTSGSVPEIQKKNIKECLKERPLFSNSTQGFRPLIDMWNVDKNELETIESGRVSLFESSRIMDRFAKLKNLNMQINSTSVKVEDCVIEEIEVVSPEDIVSTKESCFSEVKQEKADDQQPVGAAEAIELGRFGSIQANVKLEQTTEESISDENKNAFEENSQGRIREPLTGLGKASTVEQNEDENTSGGGGLKNRKEKAERTEYKTISTADNQILSEGNAEEKIGETTESSEAMDGLESNKNTDQAIEKMDEELVGKTDAISGEENYHMDTNESERQATDKVDPTKNRDDCDEQIEGKISETSGDGEQTEVNQKLKPLTADPQTIKPDNSQQSLQNTSQITSNAKNQTAADNTMATKPASACGTQSIQAKEKICDQQGNNENIATSETANTVAIPDNLKSLKTENEKEKLHPTIITGKELSDLSQQESRAIVETVLPPSNTNDNESAKTDKLNSKMQQDIQTNNQDGLTVEYSVKERTMEEDVGQSHKNETQTLVETHDILTSEESERPINRSEKVISTTIEVLRDGNLSDIIEQPVAGRSQVTSSQESFAGVKPTAIDLLENVCDANKITSDYKEDSEGDQESIAVYSPAYTDGEEDESDTETEQRIATDKTAVNTPLLGLKETDASRSQSKCNVEKIEQKNISLTEDNKRLDKNMPVLDWDDLVEVAKQSHKQSDNMPLLESEESNTEPYVPCQENEQSDNEALDEDVGDEDDAITQQYNIRPLSVLIRKLKASDLSILRQPKVRLKRIRYPEAKMETEAVSSKRQRFSKKFYFDVEESSDSLMSNSSNSSMYRPPTRTARNVAKRTKALQPITHLPSDSDCDSNKSYTKRRKRRVSTPNAGSSHSNNSNKSSSRHSTTNSGNLVVIPRSASGLKLRISHAEQRPKTNIGKFKPIMLVDEIIHVSSSSNDESNTMDSVVEVPEDEPDDPLYEEAVIELHKRR